MKYIPYIPFGLLQAQHGKQRPLNGFILFNIIESSSLSLPAGAMTELYARLAVLLLHDLFAISTSVENYFSQKLLETSSHV